MRNGKLRHWLSWLCTSFLFVCVTASAQLAEMTEWPASQGELEQRLAERVEQFGLQGTSVIIFNGDGMLWERHFTESQQPKAVAIGQLTELFTALAVMQLIERGDWSLFDSVTERLPALDIDNNFAAPLQVIHLLEHASGLDQRRFKSHFATGQRDLVQRLNREPLQTRWAPGAMSRHSAVNYAILGAMLESHYRKPWAEVVRAQVADPLGLDDSLFDPSHIDYSTLSGARGMPPQPVSHPERALMSAEGAVSQAADLASLGQLLLSRGASASPALLRADTIVTMEQPSSTLASDAGLSYGFGKGLDTRARFGYWHGKTSTLQGHSATLRYSVQYGVGYVITTRHETLLPVLDELVWQHLVREGGGVFNLVGGLSVESRWQGWYRLENPEHALLAPLQRVFNHAYVERDGADLNLQPWFGSRVPLRAIDGSRLAHRDDGSVVGVLFSDDSGNQLIQVHQDVRSRVSWWQAWTPALLVGLALLVLFSHPFGRRDALNHGWVRGLTTLATLCLLLSLFVAGSLSLEQATTDNWRNVLLFVFTSLFAILSLAGLFVTLRHWRSEPAQIAKWRCLLGALCACGLVIWFWQSGWIGIRLWAW